jgi:hypothetical protein
MRQARGTKFRFPGSATTKTLVAQIRLGNKHFSGKEEKHKGTPGTFHMRVFGVVALTRKRYYKEIGFV